MQTSGDIRGTWALGVALLFDESNDIDKHTGSVGYVSAGASLDGTKQLDVR